MKASFKFVSHRQLTAGEMAYVAHRQVVCASMDREYFDGIARPNISVGLKMLFLVEQYCTVASLRFMSIGMGFLTHSNE